MVSLGWVVSCFVWELWLVYDLLFGLGCWGVCLLFKYARHCIRKMSLSV